MYVHVIIFLTSANEKQVKCSTGKTEEVNIFNPMTQKSDFEFPKYF